ncbi:MAG: hypothetical protein IJ358_00870 [Clostridia bacterium]|nr:hypothetical protein [Clostridia bacterium]
MIITNDEFSKDIERKIKYFKEITYIVSLINTDGEMGIVCYNYANSSVWQPFCLEGDVVKLNIKAKTYGDLVGNLPPLNKDISNIRGKFYNTFDTPVEIDDTPIMSVLSINENCKKPVLERKIYYLITDVQELERTFNPLIMPCEIINFKAIDELYKNKPVDENLKYVISKLLNE